MLAKWDITAVAVLNPDSKIWQKILKEIYRASLDASGEEMMTVKVEKWPDGLRVRKRSPGTMQLRKWNSSYLFGVASIRDDDSKTDVLFRDVCKGDATIPIFPLTYT
eukprot:TRINITY_DN20375_c0_g1_i1.p1 TRINITY_DN20375_c0_g1~~TRINITY_DN20375_c0_g1_i1.p1  ORF type:complete len:107 (+),score=19.49 TRINITY_DN20375_c0_g1_i1:292-612(+)